MTSTHTQQEASPDRTDGHKAWYADGELHRVDGPAIEGVDGYKAWYADGKRLTEAEHMAAFGPPTVLALLAEVERLRTLHKDRAALIRAVSAAQDAGDDAGIELTRSDLNPIVRAALSAALGGEQR